MEKKPRKRLKRPLAVTIVAWTILVMFFVRPFISSLFYPSIPWPNPKAFVLGREARMIAAF